MLFFKDSHNDQYIKEHIIYTEQNAGHIGINAKWPSQTHWNHEGEICVEIEISTTTLQRQSISNQPQTTLDRDQCEKCNGCCQAFICSAVKYSCDFTHAMLVFGTNKISREKSMEKPIDFRSRWKIKWKRNKADDVKFNGWTNVPGVAADAGCFVAIQMYVSTYAIPSFPVSSFSFYFPSRSKIDALFHSLFLPDFVCTKYQHSDCVKSQEYFTALHINAWQHPLHFSHCSVQCGLWLIGNRLSL